MPRLKLTDAFVKSAKPISNKLTEYADTKETGLSLRVTPNGVKSWTYRYRLKSDEQRRMSLGKQRDVSLAKARVLVVNHRAIVANDSDPALEAMKARQDAKDQRDGKVSKT
ncbi:MAG: Arm DNA-binding domain-containing protein [Hyphomicrobiales bacterium]|nr:Arm DNA-binding domain-containing protein [Hyphomicrobiales bacterium]